MSHTSYWLKDFQRIAGMYQDEASRSSPEYAMKLESVRRGVANLVKIVTAQDIPVKFSSGVQSYTDSKTVVISATDNPAEFDSMAGLALHESAHIILSNRTKFPESVPLFHRLDSFRRMGEKEFGQPYVETFHDLINWLEDRRIDSWMYRNAVGYQEYYDAMYERYWEGKAVSKLLLDPVTQTPTFKNYVFRVINMTNPDSNDDILPGLRDIREWVDLGDVARFGGDRDDEWYYGDRAPELVKVAQKILNLIIRHATTTPEEPEEQVDGKGNDDEVDDSDDQDQEEALENLDHVMNTQSQFLRGRAQKQAMAEDVKEMVEHMQASAADVKEVRSDEFEGAVPVIIYQNLVRGGNFMSSTSDPEAMQAILEGERVGVILAKRLKIMGDDSITSQTRRKSGRIDKRLLAGLGLGDYAIFSHTSIESYLPVHMHVSVDASGSMRGPKWYEVLKFVAMFAKAADLIPKLEVSISFRKGDCTAHVLLAYDSKKDTFAKIKTFFSFLRPDSGTPEGICFAAIRDVLTRKAAKTRAYFVNFSDGEPMFTYIHANEAKRYQNAAAEKHTAAEVQRIRRAGVEVLSYFIETPTPLHTRTNVLKPTEVKNLSLDRFKRMYGKSAQVVQSHEVTRIAATLNKLFLEK